MQGLLVAVGFMVATTLFLEKKELVKFWVWSCLYHPTTPLPPPPHSCPTQRPGKWVVNVLEFNLGDLISPFLPQKQVLRKCKNV